MTRCPDIASLERSGALEKFLSESKDHIRYTGEQVLVVELPIPGEFQRMSAPVIPWKGVTLAAKSLKLPIMVSAECPEETVLATTVEYLRKNAITHVFSIALRRAPVFGYISTTFSVVVRCAREPRSIA